MAGKSSCPSSGSSSRRGSGSLKFKIMAEKSSCPSSGNSSRRGSGSGKLKKKDVVGSPLPGSAGWLWSDQTLALYQDARAVVEAGIQQYGSRIYLTRLFLKPCVILADSEGLKELFIDKNADFQVGMDEYFELFGENLLFMNGMEANLMHSLLYPLFNVEEYSGYKSITTELLSKWIRDVDTVQPFDVYENTKQFALLLNLRLYLGLNNEEEPEMFERFSSLASAHWHGMCSLPVNLRIPGLKSGFGNAVDAKEELLVLLKERIVTKNDHTFLKSLSDTMSNEELQLSHLLVCCCSLVPKAFASVLTSFILLQPRWKHFYQSFEGKEDKMSALEDILKEVLRLYPPFIGGRRIALKDTTLMGYTIHKDMVVHFNFLAAHTDARIFPEPEVFRPQRWREENKGTEDRMYSFGCGPRQCVGKKMIMDIMLMFCYEFIENFEWEVPEDYEMSLKYIPAIRPKTKPFIKLQNKNP